jgi:hypothetical protein
MRKIRAAALVMLAVPAITLLGAAPASAASGVVESLLSELGRLVQTLLGLLGL